MTPECRAYLVAVNRSVRHRDSCGDGCTDRLTKSCNIGARLLERQIAAWQPIAASIAEMPLSRDRDAWEDDDALAATPAAGEVE